MIRQKVRRGLPEIPPLDRPVLDDDGRDLTKIPPEELNGEQRSRLWEEVGSAGRRALAEAERQRGLDQAVPVTGGRRPEDSMLKYSRDPSDHPWLNRLDQELGEEGLSPREIHDAKRYFMRAVRKVADREGAFDLTLQRVREKE